MKNPKEIGEILEGARKKKNLTVEKVYRATRIQPNIIEALEGGKAEALLGKTYVILFLKKYASFLDMDGDSLAADYKSFRSDKEEKQALAIKRVEEPFVITEEMKKWLVPAASVLVALVFLFFTLFLAAKIRFSYRAGRKIAPVQKTEPVIITKNVFPIPSSEPIKLLLKSTGDVWMKVKVDKKVAYEGTMHKNEDRSWSSGSSIELWVGKAEALDFTINGKPVGRIGEGSIKSITVSRNGLKVGNKWVLKAD